MKSLNVKRIAALAAGAAILGATLATAGALTFSNTQIISAEGVPQVKIVVGDMAAASDGVAAANIATVIGNLAWRSQAVTATVAGASNLGCTVTGGAGAGTCAISNEKVTLSVTLPGVVSGAVGFNTYINDFVDKKLENRNKTGQDDKYNTSIDLTPFSATFGDNASVRKITASDFPTLSSPTVSDPYANKQYTEEQTLWVQSKAEYDSTLKKLVASNPHGAYKVEFTQDQSGIPVGTCDATVYSNLASPYNTAVYAGDYTKCPSTDLTERHRVHIGWLGDTYIISAMSAPTTTACTSMTTTTSECTGGSINLAKESAYGVVHVGENLTAGAYIIKLVDIEAPLGNGVEAAASIQVLDSTGTILKEDKISPPLTTSYSWTAPDGTKVRIRVYKTNPGYYAFAKWAEMAVYSQEFTLSDATDVNSDNKGWVVSLAWRNKDPTYNSSVADSLRKIILRDEDPTNILIKLGEGDTYNLIDKPTVYQLQYGGLTLGTGDYDSLSLTIIHQDFPVQVNVAASCSDSTNSTTLRDEYLLQVASSVKDAFQLSGPTTVNAQQFYVRLGNSTNIPAANQQIVFQQPGAGTCYYNMTATSISYLAGDATTDDTPVSIANYPTYWNTTIGGINAMNITFREAASVSSGVYDLFGLQILNDTDGSRKFLLSSTATQTMRYVGVTSAMGNDFALGTINAEEGYITERGSQFADVSTQSAAWKRARRLGEMKFFVKTTGTTPTTGTLVGPLGEGETANVGGGVSVKVMNITETVGACTSGGAGACLVTGTDQLTATPSVTTAIVPTPLNTATAKLVVLDKDADTAATLIVVGGNLVNTVADEVVKAGGIDLATEGVVVRAVGTKRILVAGYTGDQTTAAADQFIAELLK